MSAYLLLVLCFLCWFCHAHSDSLLLDISGTLSYIIQTSPAIKKNRTFNEHGRNHKLASRAIEYLAAPLSLSRSSIFFLALKLRLKTAQPSPTGTLSKATVGRTHCPPQHQNTSSRGFSVTPHCFHRWGFFLSSKPIKSGCFSRGPQSLTELHPWETKTCTTSMASNEQSS